MRTNKIDWQSAAAHAGSGSIAQQLHAVTAVWAAARQEYVELWDDTHSDDLALRRAVCRFQDIDRMRRSLVSRLQSLTA